MEILFVIDNKIPKYCKKKTQFEQKINYKIREIQIYKNKSFSKLRKIK